MSSNSSHVGCQKLKNSASSFCCMRDPSIYKTGAGRGREHLRIELHM
jgi:hypothetical protein